MNVRVSGNLKGRTVVFLAGWPDTSDVFAGNIMAALAPRYRLVGLTLPGFDSHSPQMRKVRRCQEHSGAMAKGGKSSAKMSSLLCPRMGYSFEELVDLLEIALLAVMEHRQFERPMLVVHDWGCVIAHEFLLSHPRFFSRVVMLDTGGSLATSFARKGDDCCPHPCRRGAVNMLWNLWNIVCVVMCQFFFILTFLFLPTFIGRGALRLFLRALRRPQYKYTNPLPILDNDTVVGEREILMVPFFVHNKEGASQNKTTTLLVDIFNLLKRLVVGGDLRGNQCGDTFSTAFYPCQYYYAKRAFMYTLPPRPTACGIQYKSYQYRTSTTLATKTYKRCHSPSREANFSITSSNGLWKFFAPSHDDDVEQDIVDVDTSHGWIFLRFWMFWVSQLLPGSERISIPISVPVQFLYGTEKPAMLHSQHWVEDIEEKREIDGSEVVPIPGGHWFFAEKKNKGRVAKLIAEFLDADSSIATQ